MDTMMGPRLEAWAALWSRFGIAATEQQTALAARFADADEAAEATARWWRPILRTFGFDGEDPSDWAVGLVALGLVPDDWPRLVAGGADPELVVEETVLRLPLTVPEVHPGPMPVQSLAMARLGLRRLLPLPQGGLTAHG